jgi:DNA-binding GntR family transcriptional regulator
MAPSEVPESMGEGAYRSIIRMILTYQFKPGDVLLEIELAERLGLSRTPVAYALGRLVAEGFLEKRKKMGCIIPVPSADDARKVFYARQVIEGQTAAAAARLARPEEIEELERALGVQDQAYASHSKDKFSDSNQTFHLGIARMARNPYFERYCRHAFWRSNVYIFYYDTFYRDLQESTEISLTQVYHRRIFEAIARRDPQEAGKLMEQHVVITYEGILASLR